MISSDTPQHLSEFLSEFWNQILEPDISFFNSKAYQNIGSKFGVQLYTPFANPNRKKLWYFIRLVVRAAQEPIIMP